MIIIIIIITGGGVLFIASENFGRMFDILFLACAFFVCVEISSRIAIPPFRPGSAHGTFFYPSAPSGGSFLKQNPSACRTQCTLPRGPTLTFLKTTPCFQNHYNLCLIWSVLNRKKKKKQQQKTQKCYVKKCTSGAYGLTDDKQNVLILFLLIMFPLIPHLTNFLSSTLHL